LGGALAQMLGFDARIGEREGGKVPEQQSAFAPLNLNRSSQLRVALPLSRSVTRSCNPTAAGSV
jgi:hypothetical protein